MESFITEPLLARFLGSDGDVVIVINDAKQEPGPGAGAGIR